MKARAVARPNWEPLMRPPAAPRRASHDRSTTVMQVATAVSTAGTLLIVCSGGTPGWAVARGLLVVALGGLVVLVVRTWPPRSAGGVVAAVGGVAAAAGCTIGLTHVATVGLSARGLGGLLAGAGGLVMLVTGLAVVLGPVRTRRRWWAVPILLLLGYGLIWPVAAAVYATNLPRPALGTLTPADRGLPYRDVAFTTEDGVRLSGWYIPSANRAAVILLHGASSTRSSVLDHAAVLARHGYGVLLFDARGHGRSAGNAMDFGWFGDRDVAAALGYLQARPEIDPARIGAVGLSMGGEEAVGALAGVPGLRAVVGEGVTGRVAADKAWLSARYGVRGSITRVVDEVTYGLADILTGATPPPSLRDAVAAAGDRPVLLIAAGNISDEADAAAYIRSGSPASVRTWVVPGAGHTGGLRTQPDAWEQRVVTFLDGSLTP